MEGIPPIVTPLIAIGLAVVGFFFQHRLARANRIKAGIATFATNYQQILSRMAFRMDDSKVGLEDDACKAAVEYLILISREFYAVKIGELDSETWERWTPGTIATLNSPLVRYVYATIGNGLGFSKDFQVFLSHTVEPFAEKDCRLAG